MNYLGYTTREQQDVYDLLPVDEKSILYAHHWDTAHKMERSMNGPKTIEIAGKRILAMPLESMGLTSEQSERFKTEVGGFEVDCSEMTQEEQIQFAKDNPEAPIDWQVSFENLQAEIDGTLYIGFDLFKKIYEAFPDIRSMTKDEAIKAGLYPTIHYRNFAARKWIAEMNGGHLATLDTDHNGELRDIYDAASGEANLQKLAAMGQAMFGWRYADFADVSLVGHWVRLGSDKFNADDYLCGFYIHRDMTCIYNCRYGRNDAVSSVVVLDT